MLEVKLKNKTVVIAAFPGMGKTYYKNNCNGFTVSDSDSSQFSWTTDEEGNKIRNPEFPSNYIEHIKSLIGKVDFIFVSTHEAVLKALIENDIYFFLVYPHKSSKNMMIQRYKDRGSDESFIKVISDNYDNWIDNLDKNYRDVVICAGRPMLGDKYVSDFIKSYLLDHKGNIYSNHDMFYSLEYFM